jgi:hypothetical protein
MENSNNPITNDISSIILNTDVPASSSGSSSLSSSWSSSLASGFFNISMTTWILIILILAFLGFNIFIYLAKGTQSVANIFGPLTATFGNLFASTTGQVVNVTAEGAKNVVSTSANVVNAGLSTVQNVAETTANTSLKTQPIKNTFQQPDITANNTLNKALNTATINSQGQNMNNYNADDTTSSIQTGAQKSGWCYIGEDRGFRTCAEVGPNDTCMSGDIFPSQEICINPNLRT